MNKPAAHRNHPINAVLRPDEPFRELARKVEYCEITWPQSYEMGEPIQMMTDLETSIIDAACSLIAILIAMGKTPEHLDAVAAVLEATDWYIASSRSNTRYRIDTRKLTRIVWEKVSLNTGKILS
jgi:hypothetical protein